MLSHPQPVYMLSVNEKTEQCQASLLVLVVLGIKCGLLGHLQTHRYLHTDL